MLLLRLFLNGDPYLSHGLSGRDVPGGGPEASTRTAGPLRVRAG